MLDPQKTTMGRVRQAYDLNNNEVEKVIQALWPDNVFPVELWRRTHETYWRAFADSNQAVYKIESPALPEIDLSAKYFWPHLCALDVQTFFRKLSLNIQASTLREGLYFILGESFEDIDAVFPEERGFLFSTLSRLETVDISDQYFPDSELFEEKILTLPISSYHFISHIFLDTVLVDTVSVIRLLHYLNIPFKKEVKGIPRSLVDSVINALKEKEAAPAISTPQQQEQYKTPHSTGSRKDIERIKATRQVCEELLKELLQERQAFENDKNTWKPNLLYSNGKTLNKTFLGAAEKRLGRKPHGAAAKEIWKKVPAKIRHNGRMPEQ